MSSRLLSMEVSHRQTVEVVALLCQGGLAVSPSGQVRKLISFMAFHTGKDEDRVDGPQRTLTALFVQGPSLMLSLTSLQAPEHEDQTLLVDSCLLCLLPPSHKCL